MKKLVVVLSLALVPTTAAAAAIAASTSTSTSTSTSVTTIRLTEKQTFQHYVDKGAKGESPGDIRTFGGTVFEHGKKVGHDRIRCVVAGRCDARITIAGGSLISAGFVVTGPNFTAPITGGTGRYSGAKGTVAVRSGPVTQYTIHLVR